MALDDLIRSGVALANNMTASLQPVVEHHHWDGVTFDEFGQPTYTVENVPALVEIRNVYLQTRGGQTVQARSKITFLVPRVITLRDKFVLPDGSTGPILDIQGLIDPDTGRAYVPEVYLG